MQKGIYHPANEDQSLLFSIDGIGSMTVSVDKVV